MTALPKATPCFHGGKFFEAIGPRFDHLERAREIINADVLDAWFQSSPRALAALRESLPWLLRTSPPTGCEGFIQTVAEVRGVRPANILPGAGSSDLIFRALRHWLIPASCVLLLDPTYGEYAHVLELVIGCKVTRLSLRREDSYDVPLDRLAEQLARGYDLVVLVNPNSPTGRHVSRRELEKVLSLAPARTRVWVDETYIDFVGASESLERFAERSGNVFVCKSMSKVYALSGARAAYICGNEAHIAELRGITPPWVMSLVAQVAAVAALQDGAYYSARYRETHAQRGWLERELAELGWDTIAGTANFILSHLPEEGPPAAEIVRACQQRGLYLRDAAAMGADLGDRAIRIAVKDPATNARMVAILGEVCHPLAAPLAHA